jgi:hypothetical protein
MPGSPPRLVGLGWKPMHLGAVSQQQGCKPVVVIPQTNQDIWYVCSNSRFLDCAPPGRNQSRRSPRFTNNKRHRRVRGGSPVFEGFPIFLRHHGVLRGFWPEALKKDTGGFAEVRRFFRQGCRFSGCWAGCEESRVVISSVVVVNGGRVPRGYSGRGRPWVSGARAMRRSPMR